MTITLGSTTPSATQAGGVGRIFTQDVVLAGGTAGNYFTKVRVKVQNGVSAGPSIAARVLVYSGTTLIDWAPFTIPSQPSPTPVIIETALTGAVPVTNGTYKIGMQVATADGTFFITTGTANTVSTTSTTTYGSAPPNPWTPGTTFSWSLAVATSPEASTISVARTLSAAMP